MAKIQENKKGFKVIKMTIEEVNDTFGSNGLCDYCAKVAMSGFYIAVLNSYYCQSCYDSWDARAVFYDQDAPIETSRYNNVKSKLHFNNG